MDRGNGPAFDPAAVRFGADGLVPAIVQDRADGRVLMVAWMDAEALAATLASGDVHFHSRSRGRLWRKGETSGHGLRLVSCSLDCDGDTLLVSVDPTGPTCHRGTRSCFDAEADADAHDGSVAHPPAQSVGAVTERPVAGLQDFAWLETLWATIARRAAERPTGSYTTSLLEGGVDAPARKVVEEATEVLMAAKDDATAEAHGADRTTTRDALAGELADLVYHALVLLAEREVEPTAVIGVLRARHRS